MLEGLMNFFRRNKDLVTMKIDVTPRFVEIVKQAKSDVEKDIGRSLADGEYIEGAMEDLVFTVDQLTKQIQMMQQSEDYYEKTPADEKDPSYG